jgi:dipeptidyl aminopeptidase/acylaminoacyl peptidase
VYALLADGANPKLARYTETDTGWTMDVLQGQHQGNIYALESSADGRTLYYNASTATMPMQIYKGEVQDTAIDNVTRLSNLNKHLAVKDLGTSEVVSWEGVNGEPVEAVLRYPPGYQADKPYPAVFVIHGGPTYTDFDGWRDTWEFPYHLISNLGVVLVSANYHGSSNFGFEFTQSIEGGHYFEYPIEDFMKGVQFLAGEGIIDPERIGITGWSNGGILPLYWITQDASLKAAVAGAGSASEYGQIAYINGMVMNLMYQNKPPFEDPEAYISMLGLYQAEKIQTPLLMFNGTADQAVVPAAAMTTYRAYKSGSHAEVKQILFPGEPHHLGHYENQLRKVMEEVNWLAKILE